MKRNGLSPLPILVLILTGFTSLEPSFANGLSSPSQDCKPVDLRKELGPPVDQGDTGWCFAFTAAQMVSHKLGQRISAMDLAIQYNLSPPSALVESRDPRLQDWLKKNPGVIKKIREMRSYEPWRLRPSQILGAEGLRNYGGEEHLTILLSNVLGFCTEKNLNSSEKNIRATFAQAHSAWRAKPRAEFEPRHRPTGEIRDEAARQAARHLREITDRKCGPRLIPQQVLLPEATVIADSSSDLKTKFPSKKARELSRQKMFQLIDSALDRKKPIAIGYDSRDLQDPEDEDSPEEHSSLIVARKKQGGSCLYFVRDSYGQDCDHYRSYLQKNCEKREGGIWVRPEQLRSIYSVVSVAD